MSRFKKIVIYTVLLIITGVALFALRGVERNMDKCVDEQRLRFSGNIRDASPLVAFTSVALGSFRGLLADMLWLRSESLKAKKSYFEMIQLARWITDLQPNYSGGTAYLAWNLAYNISVTCSDHSDRWRWVNEGVTLIRDKALLYNPNDPMLYKELSWIFLHKLGNVLDDAHNLYKNRLAMEFVQITGSGSPDWEALAAAPANKDAFTAIYTPEHKLWQQSAKFGYKNYDELFLAFKNNSPAKLPEAIGSVITPDEYKFIDNYFRAELLRERLKLDPKWVLHLDRKYGKMDWRVPESQAIYWATQGVERSPGKHDLHCARIITQALQAAFRNGKLLMLDDTKWEYVQTVPNLALADAAYEAFLTTEQEYDKNNPYSSFRSARINYLKDAIPLIYINGNRTKAGEFFQKLIKEDGMQKQRTVEEFVMVEYAEDVRDADVKKATAIISGLIYSGILHMIYGDNEAALSYERLARYIHRKYTSENRDVKRNTLAPYTMMKSSVVDKCKRELPPAMVALLNARIAAEQAEALEEKNNMPVVPSAKESR